MAQTFNGPYDVDTVRTLTTDYVKLLEAYSDVMSIVRSVMMRFEGKAISKRFETALQKELGADVTVQLTPIASFLNLKISGNSIRIPYNSALQLNMGYPGIMGGQYPDAVDLKCFRMANWEARHGVGHDYKNLVAAHKVALANVDKLVQDYNNAYAALEAASRSLNGLIKS